MNPFSAEVSGSIPATTPELKQMLHVIIDTSIYRKDPKRGTAAFRALTRLCEGSKITLYIPEFVRGEFISQQQTFLEEEIHRIAASAKSIQRRSTNEKLMDFSEQISEAANKILPKAKAIANEEFMKWAKRCRAVMNNLRPDHASRVIAGYFAGRPPFSSAKSRSDIPDSFIWQTLVDVAYRKDRVYFVANDGALLKSARAIGNVVVHSSLEAFVESAEFQRAIEELTTEVAARNVSRARRVIPRNLRALEEMVEHEIEDALLDRQVHDRRVPSDDHKGKVVMVGSAENVRFDFAKIEHYGGSELGVPFTADVECELNYAVYKLHYDVLRKKRREHISIQDLNDHYYDAGETYLLKVAGVLSVELETRILENVRTRDEEVEEAILKGEHRVEITAATIPPERDPAGDEYGIVKPTDAEDE